MRAWRERLAAVPLVTLLLCAPRLALADDIDVTSIGLVDDSLVARGSAALGPVNDEIRARLDGELRRGAPDLYREIDVGVLRYRDTRAEVREVRWERSTNPREAIANVVVELHARRERRVVEWQGIRTQVRWRPDGDAHVATVSGPFHVLVTFPAPGEATAAVTLRRLTATIHLQALHDIGATFDVNRQVASRSFTVPAVREYGLRVRDGLITDVRDERLFFDLRLDPAE